MKNILPKSKENSAENSGSTFKAFSIAIRENITWPTGLRQKTISASLNCLQVVPLPAAQFALHNYVFCQQQIFLSFIIRL